MQYTHNRPVQFADTDAAGVVHFARLLCYVEEAEHALLRELGIPLMEGGGWPRVHVECDYAAPLKMGDTADIQLSVVQVGGSSIRWGFRVMNGEITVASGAVKSVRIDDAGLPVELPADWREKLLR